MNPCKNCGGEALPANSYCLVCYASLICHAYDRKELLRLKQKAEVCNCPSCNRKFLSFARLLKSERMKRAKDKKTPS